MRDTSLTHRADMVMRVNGNSMEPTFHDGDMVLIQKVSGRNDCRTGDIIAFTADNMSYIKEFHKNGFYSHNPEYRPMYFKDYETVYCIGRVIGILEDGDLATAEEINEVQKEEKQ